MADSVQLISREIIKPSSQTQTPHPQKFKFSYLDKILTKFYIPLIFFYETDESTTFSTSNYLQLSQQMKHSLSNTLPSFYPLAGRRQNNRSVDCNDHGAEFVVARVRAPLEHVTCLSFTQLKEYLPKSDHTKALLKVQITFFEGEAVVVAAYISHAVADLASAMAFLNSWAAVCRGGDEIQPPPPAIFGTAAYFPPLPFLPFGMFRAHLVSDKNFDTRRLVFDKAKLDALRSAATRAGNAVGNPTRVELVSAFIWKHFMAARCVGGKRRKICAALHAVNLRPRAAALEGVFGNCLMSAIAAVPPSVSDEDLRLPALIGRLRKSILKIRDEGYVRKPLGKRSFLKDFLKMGRLLVMRKLDLCFFTSWRGFPTYEADYGWGKPSWVTTTSMPVKNLVVLISSKSGDDVEAIVTMVPRDLQILDSQIKLITSTD